LIPELAIDRIRVIHDGVDKRVVKADWRGQHRHNSPTFPRARAYTGHRSSTGPGRSLASRKRPRVDLVRGDLHNGAPKSRGVVIAPGVDTYRESDALHSPALMNVAVKAEKWLVSLDRIAHRGTSHRHHANFTATDDRLQPGVQLGRRLQARLIGRAVKVEDRPFIVAY